jgi:uncharacterized Tic20 family protein
MEENTKNQQEPENTETAADQNVSPEPEPAQPISKDARMWAMFCHLAGLCNFILPAIGNIIGPLIIWQLKKEEHPFVDTNGKEALNFQISITIYAIISLITFVICIGPFILATVIIFDLIFLLIAAVKANNGLEFRYPLTIRFIK